MARWKAVYPAHDVDITVRVAPQGPYEAATGPWYDITPYVRSQGINIRRGRSDEFEHFQAATCSFELNNNQREFDATVGEGFLSLPGTTGSYASTPDAAVLDLGDIDIRAEVYPEDLTPLNAKVIAAKWRDSTNNRSFMWDIIEWGWLRLITSPDGTATNQVITTSNEKITAPGAFRITQDVNVGGTNRETKFYTAPSIDGPWTQFGSTINQAGVTSIFNSDAPFEVGSRSQGNVQMFDGQIRAVRLYNGIDGTPVATPDFGAQSTGTTSFTDSAGRVWTVHGDAVIQGGSPLAAIVKPRSRVEVLASYNNATHTLYTGFIDGWPQSSTKTTGTVQVTATDALGILSTDATSISSGTFVLDNPFQGMLDHNHNRLSGHLGQQFSGERTASLLQFGGFSTGLNLDTGLSLLHELEPEGNLLQQIQDAETAEAGFLFVNKIGTFEFRDRHSRFLHPRMSVIQATFTDSHFGNLEIEYSTTQVINDARIKRSVPEQISPEGVNITSEASEHLEFDYDSIRKYGRKMYQVELPVVSQGEIEGRANFVIQRYAEPKARPGEITVKPRRNMTDIFGSVLALELLDRVAILRQPRFTNQAVGQPITFFGLVEQISHTISAEDWQTTITTSLIDVDEGQNLMRVDNAELGKLDLYQPAY